MASSFNGKIGLEFFLKKIVILFCLYPPKLMLRYFLKMDTSTEFEKKEVRLVLNFVYSKLGRYFFMLQETAQCTRVFIRDKI